jgi:hypothetical protein
MSFLVVETNGDEALAPQMTKHLIAGLEFAGQRVGAQLRVSVADIERMATVLADQFGYAPLSDDEEVYNRLFWVERVKTMLEAA